MDEQPRLAGVAIRPGEQVGGELKRSESVRKPCSKRRAHLHQHLIQQSNYLNKKRIGGRRVSRHQDQGTCIIRSQGSQNVREVVRVQLQNALQVGSYTIGKGWIGSGIRCAPLLQDQEIVAAKAQRYHVDVFITCQLG